MPVGNLAAAVGTQKEYVVPRVEMLALTASRLWKKIKPNTKIRPVSNRPTRIPLQPLNAAKVSVGNFDGGGLGPGAGPQIVPATISCVSFTQASQWTALAEYTTDSDEKAVEDYAALLQSQQTKSFASFMDILLQGYGDNSLDTVVSVSGSVLTVNNANFFLDTMDIDFWTANADSGGTYLGTSTVLATDPINVAITLTQAPPAGVATGTKIFVHNSSAVSNSGLLGIRYFNQAGNTGTYMNIQKSAYPGRFNVPNINAPGALTPSIVRAVEAQSELTRGIDEADDANLIPHCNVDMMAAWENLSLNVQRVDVAQLRGDEQPDMLKRRRPRTIAGREVVVNERARPGYIDWLPIDHMFQVQSKALSLYDVKGQVTFPAYASDGSVATSMLMYLVIMLQFADVQPQLGAYLSGVNIPKNYFGH